MALPLPPGLTPNEVGFLCEMELVTVIPRQRLDSLELLGGPTPRLEPPFAAQLPLWLALLLKRQKRANIAPPPWLSVAALSSILELETDQQLAGVFSPAPVLPPPLSAAGVAEEPYLSPATLELSPPFLAHTQQQPSAVASTPALPYHWNELGHLLLAHAADDFGDEPDAVRGLLRDLREARRSKLRRGFRVLDGGAGGVRLNGVGAMEVAEVRGFVGGFVDGLRRINRSREEMRREQAEEQDGGGRSNEGRYDRDGEDDEMEL